jgi:hypothetical protein
VTEMEPLVLPIENEPKLIRRRCPAQHEHNDVLQRLLLMSLSFSLNELLHMFFYDMANNL